MLELETANAIGDIENNNQIFSYPNVTMAFIEILINMLKSFVHLANLLFATGVCTKYTNVLPLFNKGG